MPASRWRRRLLLACAAESALVLLALPIAFALDVPLLADFRWSAADLLLGLAATVPMLALPWWVMRSRLGPLAHLRGLLEQRLLPFFAGWPAVALVLLSVVAGVSEEILFRAVLQGGLEGPLGAPAALLVASALFGAAHAVTRSYALLAAVVGLWLGGLWMLGGNLLVPIVAHAAYDAVVLVAMVRRD